MKDETQGNIKTVCITSIVSIIVAAISTYGTIQSNKGDLQNAKSTADSAVEVASQTIEQVEKARSSLVPGLYQTVYSENRQFIRSTETIPWDDTIPQQGEGARIVSIDITPKSKDGCLLVNAQVHGVEEENSADYFILALFRNSEPDAIASAIAENYGQFEIYGNTTTITLDTVLPVNGVSPIRLTLRAGLNNGAININGAQGGRRLGGSLSSSITVSEVAPCERQS